MAISRNDIRTQARDVFGKPNISFENGDSNFPKVVEVRTGRQGETQKPWFTPHKKYPQALLTQQQSQPGDNTDCVVTEVYETLPGAWIHSAEYDPILGEIQVRKRAVKYDGQLATLTATVATTYEPRDPSAIVFFQIEKTNSDGTGSDDENPAYPITTIDFYDDAKGAVQQTTQAVVSTGSEVGSIEFTQTGGAGEGTVTQIRYEPLNQFILKKVIETWDLPGPVRSGAVFTGEQQSGTLTKQLQHNDVATLATGATVVRASVQPVNEIYCENESVIVGDVFGNAANTVQRPDVLPEKFRAAIPENITAVTSAGTAGTPSLGAGEIQKSEEQVTAAKKRVSTKSRSTSGATLTGTKNFTMRTSGTVTETFANSIQTPDTGLTTVESTVDPLGDGSSIKTTVSVSAHPELKQYRYDKRVGGLVETTEQFITPPSGQPADFFGEIRIIDEAHSLRISETVPTSKLSSYIRVIPTWSKIPIPAVLKSVEIVWNEGVGEGNYGGTWSGHAEGPTTTLTGSNNGDASSSVSYIPEAIPKIIEPAAQGINTKTYFFYLDNASVTVDGILSKLGTIAGGSVQEWPVFKPEPVYIALIGGKISVQARASAQGFYHQGPDGFAASLSESDGESYDVNHVNRSLVIPATIHEAIAITGDTSKTHTIKATARVNWYGYGGFPSASSPGSSISKDIKAFVYPKTISATTPNKVPSSGFYLVDCHVEEADWGYSRVMAEVLDASKLA
jgi:hypothetical protein